MVLFAMVNIVRAQDATATTPETTPATPPVTTPAATPEKTPMAAPVAAPKEDPWRFGLTVPIWLPQINGNATVRGHQQNVDISYSELKDHLDASFALALDASKGKFDIFGNFGYMKFSGGFSGGLAGSASAELKFIVANAGVAYQLVRTEGEHPFILAETVGVRYWYVSTQLDHNDFTGRRDFHGYNNTDLFDPVVGLRASQYFTRKLHLDVAGDVGGFNISHDTDMTWSVLGVVAYDFTKWFTLSAGYQALALDESAGNGSSQKGVDLIFNGAFIGLNFRW
jgi:hypothetical protein